MYNRERLLNLLLRFLLYMFGFLGNIFLCEFTRVNVAGERFRPEGFRERIRKLLLVAIRMSWEEDPPQKVFKPRCKNLVVLESYVAKDLGEEYWAKWVKRPYAPKKGSLVDQEALMRVAERLGYSDMGKVRYVCEFLEDGALWKSRGRA